MWLLKLVGKLFGTQINSEDENDEEETDDSTLVQWGDATARGEEDEMLTVSEYVEAYKQLHFDLRGKIATQEEIRNFEIACGFAMQEAEELQDAIYYMAEALHASSSETLDEEVPDYVVKFGKALLVEYITGTLRIIQQDVLMEIEEEDE